MGQRAQRVNKSREMPPAAGHDPTLSLLLRLLQLKEQAGYELTLSNSPPAPGGRLAFPMAPETSVLTRPFVSTTDFGDRDTHLNSWYDGKVRANDHDLRFDHWLFRSRADFDGSSPGTLVRRPAWVSRRVLSAALFGREHPAAVAPHLDADAGNRQDIQ